MITKDKFSSTIDRAVLNRFREYCAKQGMNMSSRVQILMEQDIIKNGNRKTIK